MTNQIKPQDLKSRIPFYHKNMPFVAFWSEKSGCTILAKWFLFQLGLLDEASEHSKWIHDYENQVFKARENYLEDCADAINRGVPVIKFVRDPYARAVSGYFELCGVHILEKGPHWTKRYRKRVLEALSGQFVEFEYGFSFRQYVDWLVMQPMTTLDPHLQQQWSNREVDLNIEIAKIETGTDLYHSLEKRFGLKSTKGETTIFTSGHHNAKTSIAPTPWTGFADLALPIGRKKHFKIVNFDSATLSRTEIGDKLQRYFSKDFAAYDYPVFP